MFPNSIFTGSLPTKRVIPFLAALLSSFFFFMPAVTGTAFAVSPMPHELERELERQATDATKPNSGDASCTVKIIYMNGKLHGEDYFSTVLAKNASSRKDALEKAISQIEDKLRDEGIAEVTVGCRFPVSGQKE